MQPFLLSVPSVSIVDANDVPHWLRASAAASRPPSMAPLPALETRSSDRVGAILSGLNLDKKYFYKCAERYSCPGRRIVWSEKCKQKESETSGAKSVQPL